MTAHTDPEREKAIEWLHERLKPGDVVFTIIRHVSRTGMSRTVSLKGFAAPLAECTRCEPCYQSQIHYIYTGSGIQDFDYTYNAAIALGTRWPYDSVRNAIKAFSAENLIDNLAALLFGDETALSNRTL